jgi:hypothetical protein
VKALNVTPTLPSAVLRLDPIRGSRRCE